MIWFLTIEREEGNLTSRHLLRKAGALQKRDDMVVRIYAAKRELGCHGKVVVIELRDEQRSGRINSQRTGREWLTGNDFSKVLCVDNLHAARDGVATNRADRRVDETHRVEDDN